MKPGVKEVQPHRIWTIDRLFSPSECRRWIEAAELMSFEPAGVETPYGHLPRPGLRNNSRLEAVHPDWNVRLWQRIAPLVPLVEHHSPSALFKKLRFYRYQPGEQFKLHTDGFKLGDDGEQSLLTFMLFLNHDFTGGATWFPKPKIRVQPETGKALLFRHELRHAGEVVVVGVKYVLRGDVLFREG